MPVQLNLDWNKIRKEVSRLSDLDVLKTEIQKVRDEVKNFDYQAYLSPTAQKRVKDFEKRYNKLMKSVGSAQRQMDREFNKLIRQVQKQKKTAEGRIDQLKDLAETQKAKVEKVVTSLSKKTAAQAKTAKTSKKKPAAKKTSAAQKTSARKTVKKA